MTSELPENPWGRVEADGTVYVVDDGKERMVGQYPDGTPEEALAYFVRKFADLEAQVSLLEQRLRAVAKPADTARSVKRLREQLAEPNVVGDLASLRRRVEALDQAAGDLTEQEAQERRAALAAAKAEREEIVVAAERLAAQDPASIQWKRTSAELDALFARWQEHQRRGPRLPKGDANALWQRFRAARSTLETERRAFFSALDAEHKRARDAKQHLIAQAESLAPRGSDGIPEYRRLLDDWKAAGKAGRKQDDALWEQFKAAGDVLFRAKHEAIERESEEYESNLEAKLALLDEAAPILELGDRVRARQRLTGIQERWESIGRVPRDRFREIEDRFRKIEEHVKRLEEAYWEQSDPERKARTQGMSSQLHESIAKLERSLEQAQANGDARAIREAEEALSARRLWLSAVEGGR